MLKKLMLLTSVVASLSASAAEVEPLKVLLVIGGCCHDYGKQQFLLAEGIESRVHSKVTIEYTADGSTRPQFAIYQNADWAKKYDVVIHDECAADITDAKTIDNIVNAHRDGIPAVNLHCAMHSYRSGKFQQPMSPDAPEAKWFNLLGLQSSGHGPQKPIAITYTAKDHPIVKGLSDWTTINEELYNNVHGLEGNFKTWPTAKPLAYGKQDAGNQPGVNHAVVAWTNEFGPNKTRIFNTTLGHNNATIEDDRYMQLVCRGLLWACGKLDDKGMVKPGYVSRRYQKK